MAEIGKTPIDAQYFRSPRKSPLYSPLVNTIASRCIDNSEPMARIIVAQQLTIDRLRRDVTIANEVVDEDHLTGLKNRRWFAKELSRQIALSERNNSPLWMLFMDIDDFKKTNTQYGHPTGDKILQKMAQLSREGEPIARVGGEEFVQLFFEDLNPEKIKAINDRYQTRILQLTEDALVDQSTIIDVPYAEKLKGNTLSLGITQFIAGEDGEHFYERANQAMHIAKQEGKARIIIGEKPLLKS